MISADTASPIAMPGMLRQVPGWLRDKKGPLVVHPSYLPTALPWLMRWIKEGRMERVLAISDALRALHRDAFACWQDLIGPQVFGELVRRTGQIQVWDGEGESADAFYMIVDGTVRIDRMGSAARELGPGNWLGEIALVDHGPRTATATTTSPARLLVLGHREFDQMLDTTVGSIFAASNT